MPAQKRKNLRDAIVDEALKIIDETGVESLSLREVARRLGTSHQAPYKHFPSRDHILAEVLSRAYGDFAAFLDDRPKTGDSYTDLGAMGLRYFEYARAHPLHYRLMFNTPPPDPAAHPEMMDQARHAFSLLRDAIADLPLQHGDPDAPGAAELDALFVWSTIHGLVSILHSDLIGCLQIPPDALAQAIPRVLMRLSLALEEAEPAPTSSGTLQSDP